MNFRGQYLVPHDCFRFVIPQARRLGFGKGKGGGWLYSLWHDLVRCVSRWLLCSYSPLKRTCGLMCVSGVFLTRDLDRSDLRSDDASSPTEENVCPGAKP